MIQLAISAMTDKVYKADANNWTLRYAVMPCRSLCMA